MDEKAQYVNAPSLQSHCNCNQNLNEFGLFSFGEETDKLFLKLIRRAKNQELQVLKKQQVKEFATLYTKTSFLS